MKITRRQLRQIIKEELGGSREEKKFDGLEVSVLDGSGEEVIRMIWSDHADTVFVKQTLLAQLGMPTVERLMIHRGEEWIRENLPEIDEDVRVDYPEDEPRFSPEQEEA